MKKRLSIILACIVCLTALIFIGATDQDKNGYVIEVNGKKIDSESVISGDVHCVPMRKVFEELGAVIFYRNRDSQILALSRDGDIICHKVGENSMVVNGVKKTFATASFLKDYETYIPMDMVSASLCPDGLSYDNRKLEIKKHIFETDYHKLIKDVLDARILSSFHPERFGRYIDYHGKMPNYSIYEVIDLVNMGLDGTFYENVKVIEHPHELLVLVNKYNRLPEGFAQFNLVNMDRKYTVNDGKEYLLLKGTYEKFVQMSDAAKKAGLSLKVISAYRTESYQAGLYNNKLRATGRVNADNYSARPGFSEHQTGLAVDINTTQTSFESSAEFKWLQNHAHEYGFIMRYPKGKEWITGYAYEPWHYRYVGVDAAKIIHEEGITYEEFYAKYVDVNEFR